MKKRLNLSIDVELVQLAKVYAAGQGISLSELVQSYFEKLQRPAGHISVIGLVESMRAPDISSEKDLIAEYYRYIEDKHHHTM